MNDKTTETWPQGYATLADLVSAIADFERRKRHANTLHLPTWQRKDAPAPVMTYGHRRRARQ